MADYESNMLAKASGYEADVIKVILALRELKKDTAIQTSSWLAGVVGVIVSCFGVISNLFCIFILLHTKGSLKTSLRLLLSLSISDMVRSTLDIVWFFYKFDTLQNPFIKGRTVSERVYTIRRLLTSLNLLVDLSGLLTIGLLAIVTFMAVRNPLSYNTLMSKRRGFIIILFIWSTAALICISYNSILEVFRYNSFLPRMSLSGFETEVIGNVLGTFGYLADAIFVLILGLNIAIFVQVRVSTIKSTNTRRVYRLIILLILIVCSYFLTNISSKPAYFGSIMINRTDASESEMLNVLNWTPVLQSCRSFANSIVYTVRLPEIQKEARRTFCLQKYKNRRGTKTTSIRSAMLKGSVGLRKSPKDNMHPYESSRWTKGSVTTNSIKNDVKM